MGSATAIMADSRLFTAKYMGVFASAARFCAFSTNSPRSILRSRINFSLPNSNVLPSTSACTPWPAMALKLATLLLSVPRSRAVSTMANARGCSDPDSRDAASFSTVLSSSSPAIRISVTFGAPSVIVPVLSRIMADIFDAVCKASPLRISTPASAALPTPTMTDIGVARPSAQGQAIISTVVADTMAKASAGSGPKLSHASALVMAIIMMTGTKYAEITSAKRPIGGLEFCARLTILIICASAVSLPTRVALKRIEPVLLMVPAATASPSAFSTGIGSPVSMDSSMAV